MIRKSKFYTPQYLYSIDTNKSAKHLAHLQIVSAISLPEAKHLSTNFDTSKCILIITFPSFPSGQAVYRTEAFILISALQVHLTNPHQRCSSLQIPNWYSSLHTKQNDFQTVYVELAQSVSFIQQEHADML